MVTGDRNQKEDELLSLQSPDRQSPDRQWSARSNSDDGPSYHSNKVPDEGPAEAPSDNPSQQTYKVPDEALSNRRMIGGGDGGVLSLVGDEVSLPSPDSSFSLFVVVG